MNEKNKTNRDSGKKQRVKRRDFLKGLAVVPVFGSVLYKSFTKSAEAPAVISKTTMKKPGDIVRLGIIGFGRRGETLARSAGFAHPDWIQKKKRAAVKNIMNKEFEGWQNQEDLNVVITGICDVFDLRAERGIIASRNGFGSAGSKGSLTGAKRFRHYLDLLQSDEIDAVIIATPDHHHAQMTIDAVKAGKHVYCEKCMTRTEYEVHKVVNTIKKSDIVFQLGHQFSQSESFAKAKEIIESNILGKLTLVETTSNRNTPKGAWIRHVDENGNPKPGNSQTIDWDQWLGTNPKIPFSLDRYYNWTKWFTYGTGLSGQLLSHEFDSVNQLLGIGIPKSVVASGGIYFHKDNREIPDTFHAVLEYPDHELTVLYSATLANSRQRGRVFMGHDASMEVGDVLKVMADQSSTRYKKKIKQGIIDPSLPLHTYQPGENRVDAVTSATEKYYATRGLMYTYKAGKWVDLAHLHIKEWLDCIRNGGTPSCNIDKGFEVTIACHMATKSYQEKRRVEWDPVEKRIV
ncbi:MAG: Gfo/Idh/MocA family oxidoreductase [Candidatus Marinimicrobia bacterium]|nr:Gfo/Idh/MocA family oxidoreductase [Candidatus Neomarinimicrobiota bacterium]